MKPASSLFALLLVLTTSLHAQSGWYAQTAPRDDVNLFEVWMLSSQHAVAVGDYGTIYTTTNGGTNWEMQSSGTQELLTTVKFLDAGFGLAAGQKGTLLKSTNGGASWSTIPTGATESILDVHIASRNTWILTCSGGVIRMTTNAGASWANRANGFLSNNVCSICFVDDSTGWVVGFQGKIAKTTNGGLTWREQSSEVNELLYAVAAASPTTVVAVGRSGIILRTTDGGRTWGMVTTGIAMNNSIKDLQFVDSLRGYLVAWNGIILRTDDAGETWGLQDNPATTSFEGMHFLNRNVGYAVGWDGMILRTDDGGPVGVETTTMALPSQPVIGSGHPSPARAGSTVTVDVTLPEPGAGEMVVSDLLGRDVVTLRSGFFQAGRTDIVWNAAGLSPGMHVYRLRLGGVTTHRSFLVVP